MPFRQQKKILLAILIATVVAAVVFLLPFPDGKDGLALTHEEQQWLAQHHVVRLGVTPSTRPLEYFGDKAEYKGMVADYMHLLAERLGIDFEVVEATNLKSLLSKAEAREVDMIAAFWANPASIKYMSFTRPYLVLPTVILVNKNMKRYLTMADMDGMELALPQSNAVIDYVRKYYPEIHIQPVYNYLAALLHISFDEIDATIISLPQASYFIEEKGITNLRVAGHTDYKLYNRIATRSDWPIMNSILQKGLDSISENEHNRIYRRWVTIDQHYITFLLHNKKFWVYFIFAFFIIVLFIGFIVVYNRILHKRVNSRTLELKKELNARIRLLAAIEQSQDGIFIIDTEGIIGYVNPAFEHMSGYSKTELCGEHVSRIRSNRHEPEFYRDIWEALGRGEVWRGQTTYTSKSGKDYEVDQSISPVYDEGGDITGFVEVARDITERLRMEKQLRQSQKLEELGTLAGGIAHDFNNILAAVLGYAELALPSLEENTRGRVNMERIRSVALRAREMVNQILVFSRRREPTKRLVNLVELLREVVNFLQISLPPTIEVRLAVDVEQAWVMGDSSQVHQVITNLGTNAAYAMGQNDGVLAFRLERVRLDGPELLASGRLEPGEYFRLTVSDTGMGIPEDIIGRIFDPFFTTKPQSKGTGLGLSMAHGTIMSMNGGIQVKSHVGRGTVFEMYLPEAGSAPLEERKTRREIISGQGRVLFVDDENDIVRIGEQMLSDLGYTVTGINDSRKALELFRSSQDSFDLLVTDQIMPGMTGDHLIQAVHRIRPDLPAILCTGFSTSLETLKHETNVKAVLMKPFEMAKLSKVVALALRA
ncbi:transporter substrate-binding domain-containing protein [Desulfovibrio aminophilus]|uniref:PAS domain S-box protein n=1 Tax=Desulfovibrio aminophilus TaxID=81425 RepID=UPI0033950DDE